MSDFSGVPTCSHCGSPLPDGVPESGCPRCLMAQIIEPTRAGDDVPIAPVPDPAELAPHFPQLEILECLGRGGMGVVYKARQKSLNRMVALKLLTPERSDDPKFAARFETEAQALAALSHPHIVAVHDFGEAGGYYYLLMEYVDGVDLRQLLQAKRLTPKEALSIVPPVCDALQCAHDRGIVHCDIKPENLLIDKAGVVKIADFGIARIAGLGTASEGNAGTLASSTNTAPLGTPEYSAPEQAEGGADFRADIYSLGVVLYEMLTGERPGEKIEAPSRRVQVDIRIDEIVLRALEKEPNLRFATAHEFRTRVEAVVGADPEGTRVFGDRAIARVMLSHLTPEERREATWRASLFGVWNAATFFAPVFSILFLPSPLNWVFGVVALAVGLSFYPFFRRLERSFLCGTAWAKARGISPNNWKDGLRLEGSASPDRE